MRKGSVVTFCEIKNIHDEDFNNPRRGQNFDGRTLQDCRILEDYGLSISYGSWTEAGGGGRLVRLCMDE